MFAVIAFGVSVALVAHGIAYLWPERWLLHSHGPVVGGVQSRRQAASWTMNIAGVALLIAFISVIDSGFRGVLFGLDKALLIPGLVMSALVGVATAKYRLAVWARKETWPAVPANILSGETVRYIEAENKSFYALVTYEYAVDGEYYSGETRFSFDTPSQADQCLSRFKNGAVQVKYDPRRPDKSVLFIQ